MTQLGFAPLSQNIFSAIKQIPGDCYENENNITLKCLFLNFHSIFSAEVLITGVAGLALRAGCPKLIHRLASIVSSNGVVTHCQGLVGQEWPHLFRVVAEATADLVGLRPDNLSVVAGVVGEPAVRCIVRQQPTRLHQDLSHEGVHVGAAEARRDDFIVPAQ